MIDWATCTAVEQDPEKVSNSWVFRGTRVPVVALFENLEGGASVEDFLSRFPVSPVSRLRPSSSAPSKVCARAARRLSDEASLRSRDTRAP